MFENFLPSFKEMIKIWEKNILNKINHPWKIKSALEFNKRSLDEYLNFCKENIIVSYLPTVSSKKY